MDTDQAIDPLGAFHRKSQCYDRWIHLAAAFAGKFLDDITERRILRWLGRQKRVSYNLESRKSIKMAFNGRLQKPIRGAGHPPAPQFSQPII